MKICDVAVNIFAKPYQTSLAILSLLRMCGSHIRCLWLQFEPAGSRFDTISPYTIAWYLKEKKLVPLRVFQPEIWFDCKVAERSRFSEEAYRLGLRFECALEQSDAQFLYLLHNDVFIQKDILGAMLQGIGKAFAIGPIGQCWNCPASKEEVTMAALNRPPCVPSLYTKFKPSYKELVSLYACSDSLRLFKRSYADGLDPHFLTQPWPLPECRVNEWSCLVNLEMTRGHTIPFGDALPIGCYEQCGTYTLDIGVSWFRSMHALGFTAAHFPIDGWMRHFGGTGNKSQLRYTQGEDRAKKLLSLHFPEFIAWLGSH
ncbi:MAG: hypothetical protein IJU76_11315 [Desulfovibrionaceae bacterium]|nr:hypothetical protein [Desulfovibrionaceae bacterium]